MLDSLQNFLRPLARCVPPRLISADWFARMAETACWLPGELTESKVGLECDLSDERPHADLAVCLRAHQQGGVLLRDMSPPPHVASHEVWRRLRTLGQQWSDSTLALDHVWLEFDMATEHRHLPSLFFRPRAAGSRGRQYADYADLIRSVFEVVGAEPVARLRPCIERVAAYATVFQAGLMLPRESDAVRLCLWTEWTDVPRLLADLGLEWGLADVAELVQACHGSSPAVTAVQIEVAAAIRPIFAIEVRFSRMVPSPREVRDSRFLRWLVERGYACDAKYQALLEYSGYSSVADAPVLWPQNLNAWRRLADASMLSTLVRWVQHVKVVFRPGEPPRCKAYVAFKHYWKPLHGQDFASPCEIQETPLG